MASGKLLRKLVRAGSDGDRDSFREAAEEVIRQERQKQHHLLANDLERILYGRSRDQSRSERFTHEIPTDSERGLPLLTLREPARQLDDLILANPTRETIESVLLECRRREELSSYGLRPVSKMLFYGPPGCGKTASAEALAYELDLPLAVIRIDGVVSSFLGQTAANLRGIFDFIEKAPCVALFDEFDAIGKARADGSDHGELRRVVNSVLQMMDDYTGESLIVAATNHERMLDPAVWRRFEEVLLFAPPDDGEIVEFVRRRLRGVRLDMDLDTIPVAEWFAGWSFADIERVLIRSVKEMVVGGGDFLRLRHLELALQKEAARRASSETAT